MKNRTKLILSVLTGGIMLLSTSVSALDIPIKITGEIFIPPCKMNSDADFKVPFGKIPLQKVDGRNYAKTTTVDINCEHFQGKPYIRLSGGTGQLPGAPDNVLNTTGANPSMLGIALYQGNSVDSGNPLRLGGGQGRYGYEIRKGLSVLNIKNSQFTFTAVPYKHGIADLKAGSFEATVTMSISYL